MIVVTLAIRLGLLKGEIKVILIALVLLFVGVILPNDMFVIASGLFAITSAINTHGK